MTDAPAPLSAPPRPAWYGRIIERWAADKNQFLLDFNIRDKVFIPEAPPPPGATLLRVGDYLRHDLATYSSFSLVLAYSLTTGITLVSGAVEESIKLPFDSDPVQTPAAPPAGPSSAAKPPADSPAARLYQNAAKKFSRQLMEQLGQPTAESLRADRDPTRAMLFLDRLLTQQFTLPAQLGQEPPRLRIALIIDYLENLAPAGQARHRDQVLLAETLGRWATSAAIRRNNHLILLLTEDINRVDPALYSGAGGTVNVRLERPGPAERLAFVRWLAAGGQMALDDEAQAGQLAALTAGFNFAEIEELAAYARQRHGGHVGPELIRERKADVIRSESRTLLEFVETDTTFDHVGGLDHVKQALRDVSGWLRSETTARLVPKGLLFVGPPGTGKSLVAQALANEGRVNMVKLRDVQSMWVGESESNMSRVLDVARAFAPVIIFVDEIDQAYGQRSSGDSSGVSSRLFGKLLEFIGDNANRGKVLWVAASNRPDFVDAALVSRFDRIVPFLLPDRANREAILLHAMPRIVRAEWQHGPRPGEWPADAVEAWAALLAATDEYSGRELELVTRRGLELADGRHLAPACVLEAVRRFKHSHNRDVYRLQTLLALQVTNFKDYLPAPDKLMPRDLVHLLVEDGEAIDWEAIVDRIEDEIAALRQKLRS